MEHEVTLLMSEFVTHDVKRYIVSRPDNFDFKPGQGVELAINTSEWREEGRPFTPVSTSDDKVVEFIIKGYPQHEGVTRELHKLKPGAKLLMSEPFGTIEFQGAGTFIAGGAGITPFIAILRDLASKDALEDHRLLFSNKSPADIICAKELRHYLGGHCKFICTGDADAHCEKQRIDTQYLRENIDDFEQHFYLCGPPGFMDAITEALKSLGADPQSLVFEQ